MADEETVVEDQVIEENSEATEQTDESAGVTEQADTVTTEQFNELQSKFDTLSGSVTEKQQLIDQLTPYVDFDKLKGGNQDDGLEDNEGDETFLTQKEAKALEVRLDKKIKSNNFMNDFRTTYPDLGDKGVKEEMVRYFFEKEKAGSFDQRVKKAVEATRNLLKTEQAKGTEAATTKQKEKDELEAKKKVSAAKAGGLGSGITTPSGASDDENESNDDYLAKRRLKSEQRKAG